LASPMVARALAADELWREVAYTRRVADGYATGRIDLVFREGDELVVADRQSESTGPAVVDVASRVVAGRSLPGGRPARPTGGERGGAMHLHLVPALARSKHPRQANV